MNTIKINSINIDKGQIRIGKNQELFDLIDDNTISLKGTSVIAKSIQVDHVYQSNQRNYSPRDTHKDGAILDLETKIREYAYKHAIHEDFDAGFFGNSDMHEPYTIHVVFDKENMTPLISARSFTGRDDILQELRGHNDSLHIADHTKDQWLKCDPGSIVGQGSEDVFMIDRMSQMIGRHSYRGLHKMLLFGLLYRSFFKTYRNYRYVLALARIDYSDVLLSHYIPLGLKIIGYNRFMVGANPKKHWVLRGDLPRIRKNIVARSNILLNIYK